MYNIKDHKTMDMFDPFKHLGPKRRSLLDGTWAKLFRDEVLPNLPVHLLKKHYHPINGRPTHELYAMMGAAIIQHMQDLTDQEAVQQYCFNIMWQFALNITNATDTSSYVCERTVWEMRKLITEDEIHEEIFSNLSDHLQKLFEVDTSLQRIDSVHLFSNMRHLGRIRIFAETIKKFFVNFKRQHKALFDELPEELPARYLPKNKTASIFSMVKPSESSRTLEELSNDLFSLVIRFRDHEAVSNMATYQMLVRLLSEQCVVAADPETKVEKVSVKPNKEVASDSLQNPSDPDATYCGHKGKGYQAQIAETYSRDESGEPQLNLITHVNVQTAVESDAKAMLPYLEEMAEREICPTEVLADSLYGSDQNREAAKTLGVELIAPTMGSVAPDAISLADFTINDADELTACPAGHAPEVMKKTKKKGRFSAMFPLAQCEVCPKKEACPVKPGKKGYFLRYDSKAARLAKLRVAEMSEFFREKYRFRSGIEGAISQLDRRTGVKQLRVRGMKAVKLSVFLKVTGLNILRAAAFSAARNKKLKKQLDNTTGGYFCLIYVLVKERLTAISRRLVKYSTQIFQNGIADDCQQLRLVA